MVVALTCVFVVSSVVSREYDIERVLVVLIAVWWLLCCLLVALQRGLRGRLDWCSVVRHETFDIAINIDGAAPTGKRSRYKR